MIEGSEEVCLCRDVEEERAGTERGVEGEVAESGTCRLLLALLGEACPCTGWFGDKLEFDVRRGDWVVSMNGKKL